MKIESTLVNMGEHRLQEVFLSKACIETLKTLDPVSIEPERLRQIVLERVSQSAMLRDKAMRSALIMALTRKRIVGLARELQLACADGDDLYSKICRMSFRKNSNSERVLFGFFEVVWEEHESPAVVSSIDTARPAKPLFDHQIAAILTIKRKLDKPGARALLHMPTGAGKTKTALMYVADVFLNDPDALVIWLAHSEELCEQAIEEFVATWGSVGNQDVRVYRLYGNHAPDLLSKAHRTGLIVAGLSKMFRLAQRHDMFLTTLADRMSLVVIDEAHQAIAETYEFILDSLVEKHNVRLLGLSATPGRTWNDRLKDEKLALFFHRNKVTLNTESPIDFLVKNEFIARQAMERLEYKDHLIPEDLERLHLDIDIPQHILDKLARDIARNIMIISKLEEMISKGHTRIIYFATSVANAKDISMTLHARRHRSSYIDAATPGEIRNRAISEYKSDSESPIILCNFGVLTAGFDAPKTTAVLIARPTKSLVLYSQMVGRAIRGPKVGGTKRCTIATVVDTSLPGFDSMVSAFGNWEDVWD